MEKSQADAIAEAILEPVARAQKERRRKHVEALREVARQRWLAGFSLAGGAIGSVVAYYLIGGHVALGVIWGCVAGSAVGWLIRRLRGAG